MGVNVLDISGFATTSEVLPRKGARDLRFWVLAWHMLSDVRCFSSRKRYPDDTNGHIKRPSSPLRNGTTACARIACFDASS